MLIRRHLNKPLAAFALLMACLCASNSFALTPAGQDIINIGRIEFTKGAVVTGQDSNPASVKVAGVLALTLKDDNFFDAVAGQTVIYTHQLTNTGNLSDSYQLQVSQQQDDAGEFVATKIFLDANQNGLVDADEVELSQTQVLPPNDMLHFLISAEIPLNATVGQTYSLTISATSTTDNSVGASNLDGIIISENAVLSLNKSSSELCQNPLVAGQQYSYSIDYSAMGGSLALTKSVSVDGTSRQGLLIEDELPSAISLVQNAATLAPASGQFIVLPDANVGANEWLSFASWNGQDSIAKVGFLLETNQVTTGDTGSFSFDVVVNANPAAGLIENTSRIDVDNDGSSDFQSNTVCNTIPETIAFDLDPDRSLIFELKDDDRAVFYEHQLFNQGTVDDRYTLQLSANTGNTLELEDTKIFIDDGDGVLNAGDTLYTGGTIAIAIGNSERLFVTGNIPSDATILDLSSQLLSATSQRNPSVIDSHKEIVEFLAEGPAFILTKTSSKACELIAPDQASQDNAERLIPSEEFTYTIAFKNGGDSAPLAQSFDVDGSIQTGVMLFDAIPYGLSLSTGQSFAVLPSAANVVVMRYEDRATAKWLSYSAWNGSDALAVIGVLYEASAVGKRVEGSFTFSVKVNETVTAGAAFFNTAFFDYDNNGNADAESNQVCNLVELATDISSTIPTAEIRFLAPTLDLILGRVAPEHASKDQFVDSTLYRLESDVISYNASTDGVFIEVSSSTLREGDDYTVLPDGRRQVLVDVESSGTGDKAKVILRETVPGSGVYRSIRSLVLSDVTGNGGGVCPDDINSAIDYTAEIIGACRLLSQQDDGLIVSITDTGINKRLEDDAIVDPLGIVFDAITLQPVAGATVVVCTHLPAGEASDPSFDDGDPNDQCGLFGEIAINPFSPTREPLAIQTTGTDGFYQYAFLFVGDYYIDINPPEQYAWPSKTPIASFDGQAAAGRDRELEILDASYGQNGFAGVADSGVFALSVIRPILVVDLPVDPVVIDLNVTSNCDANGRVAGDIAPLTYSVSFQNTGNLTPPERTIQIDGTAASGVLFENRLPFEASPFAGQPPTISPNGAGLLQTYADLGTNNWLSFAAWDGVAGIAKVGALFAASDIAPGATGSIAFEVDVTGNLTDGTVLTNTITVDVDADGSPEAQAQSACNVSGPEAEIRFLAPTTALRVNAQAPDFSNDADFVDVNQYRLDGTAAQYNTTSDGIYIQLSSTAIPDTSYTVLADGRRQVVVDVSSTLTGEIRTVTLQEVTEGGGVYRAVRPLVLSLSESGSSNTCPNEPSPSVDYVNDPGNDCILHSGANDTLVVSFIDALGPHTDEAIVDPLGVVFNSQTLQPVAGATVSIRNLDGSLPNDPFTGQPLAPQITGTDGRYQYPFMFPGSYYLTVEPPTGYAFPSEQGPTTFTGTGFTVIAPSYGRDGFNGVAGSGEFALDAVNNLLVVDFPIDFFGDALLTIDKSASLKEVELGGVVQYTVNIRNVADAPISNIVLADQLPYGFKYIERTLRLANVLIAEPAGAPGPRLSIPVGTLLKDEEVSIQYYLQATAGAVDSDGINTAIARGNFSGAPIESNVARAKVELTRRGVLSDKAFIFGKIFVDADCNNIQSKGEWPIGAVKVYMENGTYAITDENGQYSLYGLEPGLHIVKVDPLTLPMGLTLKPIDNRHAADGDSRFVDLVSGDYHRADFAAACPSAEDIDDVQTQITLRNQAINANWMLDEAERFDPTQETQVRSDLSRASDDGELSQGLLGSSQTASLGGDKHGASNFSPITPTIYNAGDVLTLEADTDKAMPITETVVKDITMAQAKAGEFLWPLGDTSLYGRFMVVVRSGLSPQLYMNGSEVSQSFLGERFINKSQRAEVLAWYGLQLDAGANLLEVKALDPFGNMRVLASKTFHSPGAATGLELSVDEPTLAADGGRSASTIRLKIVDEFGKPARGTHFVTLEANDGLWVEADIQDKNPGHQIRVRNGEATLHLRSSEYTGKVTVKASADTLSDEIDIVFIASNRSLVVAGIAKAGYQSGSVNDDGNGPTAQKEGLDDNELDTSAALFLKGRIKGDMHLTLSYDTEKDSDGDLLRDINPNEYYPIQGDNSVRGFEAQSRSKLYAKLEKDRSSLLWGDYVTGQASSYRDIARVQRTLTGVRGIYDNGKLKALVFGAKEEDNFQQIEIPSNGTALLYQIPNAPIVRNSENLELITRDRDSRALIVNNEPLRRFIDYTVDHLSGNLRFTRALPSFDEDNNPVFIRISYNVEGNGQENTVAGANLEYNVNDRLTVGGSYISDDSPTGSQVSGVFANLKLNDKTAVLVSLANMTHQDGSLEDGDAVYTEITRQWDNGSETRVTAGRADVGFTNGGAGVSADNQELRVNHSQKITNKLSVNVDYLNSEKLSGGNERTSTELRADYRIKEWTLRAGTRNNKNDNNGLSDTATTGIIGASRNFSLLGRSGNLNAEYEVETGDSSRKRWAADANWQAFEKAKVYGRYEQLNSLSGTSGFNSNQEQATANFGMETTWLPSTTVYNEYRMRGVTDGRDLEAATGVRGDYEIIPGLKVSPTLEIIDTMEGSNDNSSTAVSIGLTDSRDKNARKLLRVETRFDDSRKYYGFDGTYVARVNMNWSSFFREDLRVTEVDNGDDTINHVFTVGFAHRPRLENRYHGLWLYQWKLDKDSTEREVHLFSTHQNMQLSDDWIVSGRFGFKWEEYDLLDTTFATNTMLLDGRVIWDMTRRIDLDIHGGLLATNDGDELRYALGLGANFLLHRNLRVNAGYNVVGFKEEDLDGEGYNAFGAYIGLQFKFDENAFDWLAYDPTQALETNKVSESGNE